MHRPWFDFERFRGGRMFERGDLKYVILQLLSERPAHGYEVIRALEERFGGMYTPSAGAVYPTLQMLEDMGYVTSTQQDGRRVYSITEEGRTFLESQRETVEGIRRRTGAWWDPQLKAQFRELRHDMQDFVHSTVHSVTGRGRHYTSPETIRQVREVLSRARKEIEDILREQKPSEEQKEPETEPEAEKEEVRNE
jgi:DNA-binding PadR family transcriptional regulator